MSERQVDQKLIVKVQQGDKTAFDVLVLKYQHKVIKVIMRYIRDPSEALDVPFSAAFRRLFKHNLSTGVCGPRGGVS